MSLYHFGLYLLRRKDLSSLWFGILCAFILIRLLVTGERLAFQNVPDFPFWLGQKLEYLSIYLTTPAFALFFWSSFRAEIHRPVIVATLIAHGALAAVVLATPLVWYSRTLMIFFVSALLFAPYSLYFLITAVLRGRDRALAALRDPEKFQIRRLGRVQVKGKRETVSVYEVFNDPSPVLVDLLRETRGDFEAGLSAFERRDMTGARQCFERVLEAQPGGLYVKECVRRMPARA